MNNVNQQVVLQTSDNKCKMCEMKKQKKDYEKLLTELEQWEKDVLRKDANKESPNDLINDYFDEYDDRRKQSEYNKKTITTDARRLGFDCKAEEEQLVVYPHVTMVVFEFHFTSCIKKKKGTQDEMAENVDTALFNISEAMKNNSNFIRNHNSDTVDKAIRKKAALALTYARTMNELKRLQNSNNLSLTAKHDI
jgi:hypothetical protein